MLCRDIGAKRVVNYALEGLANLFQRLHQPERAVCLYGAVQALRKELGVPLPSHDQEEQDRCLTELEVLLGKDRYTAVFAEGQAMTMEQAIAYALEEAER